MSDVHPQLKWTDDQWTRVRQAVHEEAQRVRVGASFLPLVGPLPADQQVVSRQLLTSDKPLDVDGHHVNHGIYVDDYSMARLSTLAVNVYVRGAQVADPSLQSALQMFRRAANVIARLEDAIIFNGETGTGKVAGDLTLGIPDIYTITGGQEAPGLASDISADATVEVPKTEGPHSGRDIVKAVVEAIEKLEGTGHVGPFACVLGDDLFLDANTPNHNSMVLPSDRITPFLNGPLLRSSTLPRDRGVVVSLAGAPVDLVIAKDMSVQFLQISFEPLYVFRVYERMHLRIKERDAVVLLKAK